jgi:hypothetical protein
VKELLDALRRAKNAAAALAFSPSSPALDPRLVEQAAALALGLETSVPKGGIVCCNTWPEEWRKK